MQGISGRMRSEYLFGAFVGGVVLVAMVYLHTHPLPALQLPLHLAYALATALLVTLLLRKCRQNLSLASHAQSNRVHLQVITENLPVVVYALDATGRFTYSDGKGLQRLGLKPHEVVGQDALHLYRDYPEIVDAIQGALQGETLTRTLQLGDLWYQCYFVPQRDANGRVQAVIGVSYDISDLKRVEHQLQMRLHVENTLAAIASNYIRHPDFDWGAEWCLSEIARLCGADRAGLWLLNDDGTAYIVSHRWFKPQSQTRHVAPNHLPLHAIAWGIQQIEQGPPLFISDPDTLPAEAEPLRRLMKGSETVSLLALPVRVENKLVGFMTFANLTRTDAALMNNLHLLQIAADITGGMLQRKQAMQTCASARNDSAPSLKLFPTSLS